MATTTLRAYLKELDVLLDKEALEEAIGHCRHILQHFPKNVATYRILGRALLERGRYAESSEVFQRVLAAVPDDFTAHLGLSSAFEHTDLNAAIWHLERAYEQEPTNVNIQDELRKLYGLRDGVSPEHVQLSRGALARLYVRGQLYDQASSELERALEESPNRIDWLVLLCRTLWDSEHPVEACEVALRVLEKLPDCIEANRVLTALWISCGRPAEAEPFLLGLEQADPFLAWATIHPNGPELPISAFQVPHLQWDARTAASLATDVPDWVANIGDVFAAPDSVQLSTPQEDAFSQPPTPAPFSNRFAAPEPAPSPSWLDEIDLSTPSTEPAVSSPTPDWYADADIDNSADSDEPAPVDAMAWLQTGTLPDLPDLPDTNPDEPANALSWLQTGPLPDLPEAPEISDAPAEAMSWLETGPLPDLPDLPGLPETPETVDAPAEAMSWLETGPLPDLPDADLPTTAQLEPMFGSEALAAENSDLDRDWMAELGMESLLGEELTEPATEPPAIDQTGEPEEFDWLNSKLGLATPAVQEPAADTGTDWITSALGLEPLTDTPETPVAEVSEADNVAVSAVSDDFNWLNSALNIDEEAPEIAATVATEPSFSDEPAWLTTPVPEAPATAVETPQPADDLDWLTSSLDGITDMLPTAPESASVAEEAGFDWLSGDALSAAESLSAEATPLEADLEADLAPADLSWMPADLGLPADIVPTAPESASVAEAAGFDWLSGDTLSAAESLSAETPPLEADLEADLAPADLSWMPADLGLPADIVPTAPESASVAEEAGFDWSAGDSLAVSAEPLAEADAPGLDWLSTIDAIELPADLAAPAVMPTSVVPNPVIPSFDDLVPDSTTEPEAAPDFIDQEDPMAWLKQYQQPGEGQSETKTEAAYMELSFDNPAIQSDEGPDLTFDSMGIPEPTPLTTDAVLDWLNKNDTVSTVSTTEPADALDWMMSGSSAPTPSRPVTDWLGKLVVVSEPEPPIPPEIAPVNSLPIEAASAEIEIEDEWLRGFEAEPEPAQAAPEPVANVANVANSWLDTLGIVEEEPPAAAIEPSAPPVAPLPPVEEEKTPLWKRSVVTSALQTASLKSQEPDFFAGSEPDWMRGESADVVAGVPVQEERATTGILPSDVVPDWLSALAESAPAEVPASPEPNWVADLHLQPGNLDEVKPETTEVIPDWLKAMAPTAEQPMPTKPVEELDFSGLEGVVTEPDLNLDIVAQPSNLGNTSSTPEPQPETGDVAFSFKKEPPWKRKLQQGTDNTETGTDQGSSDGSSSISAPSRGPVWKRKKDN